MDPLALLCNLYAEGPSTLQRLRQAGCTTFQGLDRIPATDLAEILSATPEAAQRFLREARSLAERLDDDAGASPASLAPARRDTVERLLQRPGTPLEPHVLDGLVPETCRRLIDAGVATLESLREADGLKLSSSSGVPFTQISRLQFLARRAAPAKAQSVLQTPQPQLQPQAPEPPPPAAEPTAPFSRPAESARFSPAPDPSPARGPLQDEIEAAAGALRSSQAAEVSGPFA